MSYPYSIVRNGYSIPLTSVYSGYNSSGSTPGFGGMGSFDIATVNYNKQNPIDFYYNGTTIFPSNVCSYSTPNTLDTVYYGTIPGGVSGISFILIGGGGSSQGYDGINEVSGVNGGSGGFLFINCSCSAGMNYTIKSGSGAIAGSPTPFQGDGFNGADSVLNLNGYYFGGLGGGGGIGSQNVGYAGGYSIPSVSGITIYQSYGGNGIDGAGIDNFITTRTYNGLQNNFSSFPTGQFDTTFNNYGLGGVSSGIGAGSNGIAIMYFHY